MFHFSKIHAAAAGLWVAGAAACAIFGGTSAPASPPPASVEAPAPSGQSECRASSLAIDAEIERLRQSCDLELEAFAACRAARPTWDTVELFSCSFEMSTSLAKGDVEDPASLEDCGTPTPREIAALEAAAAEEHRADCPVPACEADLEKLEALKTEPAC